MTRATRIAAATLALLAAGAVLGPILAPADPVRIGDVVGSRFLPPLHAGPDGHFHLFGTDRFGRDLFVRMLLAARISLAIGVAGSLLGTALGTAIGAVAAWRGGIVDRLAMAATDTMLAIPRLVLLLLCAALWRPGLATIVAVLVGTGWMAVARMVRTEVMGVRTLPYVEAARALGVPGPRLLWRHVVPNALGPAIVAATLGVGNTILLESGLSFLGLGIQPPQPSWGNMISGGRDVILTAPWVAIAPGLALVITVLACTALGDAARRALGARDATGLRHG